MPVRKQCPTCCNPVAAPYRRIGPDGRYTEGCVDACHGPHLVRPSGSYDWHMRKEAKAVRAMTAARLSALVG